MRRQPAFHPDPLRRVHVGSNLPLLFGPSPHVGEKSGGPPADASMEDMAQSETHPAWWVDAPDTLEADESACPPRAAR